MAKVSPISPVSAGLFRSTRLLLNKKHRLESGTCLIEGRRFVEEALARRGTVVRLLLEARAAGTPEGRNLIGSAERNAVPVFTISAGQVAELSDTVSSQGIMAVIRLPASPPGALRRLGGDRRLLVALDGVTDPGNLGTIVRTCAWFGADGLLVSARSVELSNPKLLRATMGAVFAVPVETGVVLPAELAALRKEGFRILAGDARGRPARTLLRGSGRRVLVFGSEAHGLSGEVRDAADDLFGIEGSGRIESLNVTIAVGIALAIASGN